MTDGAIARGEGGLDAVRAWSQRAIEAIGRDRILGVVLNRATPNTVERARATTTDYYYGRQRELAAVA